MTKCNQLTSLPFKGLKYHCQLSGYQHPTAPTFTLPSLLETECATAYAHYQSISVITIASFVTDKLYLSV